MTGGSYSGRPLTANLIKSAQWNCYILKWLPYCGCSMLTTYSHVADFSDRSEANCRHGLVDYSLCCPPLRMWVPFKRSHRDRGVISACLMDADQPQINGQLQLCFIAHPQYGNSWRKHVGGFQPCRRAWRGWGGGTLCLRLTFLTSVEELKELNLPVTACSLRPADVASTALFLARANLDFISRQRLH